MRLVTHSDQALVLAILIIVVCRHGLLGDIALCNKVEDLTLIYLTLVEVFSTLGIALVALKYDGWLLSMHYSTTHILFLLLVHPFSFHQQWTFLPLWISAVLLHLAWSFHIDSVPLFYRTLHHSERTHDAYLQMINMANAMCIYHVNSRKRSYLPPAVEAIGAYDEYDTSYGHVRYTPTPITKSVMETDMGHETRDGDGGGSAGGAGVRRRRRSLDDH